MITSIKKLIAKFQVWMQSEIPDARTDFSDSAGRKWFLTSIEYPDKLKLSDLRDFVDRQDLNDEFVERYKNKDIKSRKGVSALKVEISALYSFSKCFVQRYKGRMHFYRDDLSQKAVRNMRAVSQASAIFKDFKSKLD